MARSQQRGYPMQP